MMMNKTAVEDQKAKEEAQAYATLMRTVESLQSDLQQTIVTCHELREGKESAEKAYDALRSEVEGLRQSLQTTRNQLVEATTAKIESDRNTELVVTKWKSQLDDRTAELEAVQEKLGAPQDLDMLRIEIQEELEVPHQQKISEIEHQLEASQAAYFDSKREVEQLKARSEQALSLQVSAFKAEKDMLQTEVASYKDQVQEYESRLAQATSDGPLREVRNHNQALIVELETLKKEAVKHTEEATQARLQASELVAAKTQLALEAKATADSAQVEAQQLSRKIELLETQVQEAQRLQSAAMKEQRRLEVALNEADGLRRKAEDSHRKKIRELTANLEIAQRECAEEADEANRKRTIDTRRIASLEQALLERKRLDFEAEARLDAAVEAVRLEVRETLTAQEQKVIEIEMKAAESVRSKDQDLFEAMTSNRKLQAQLKIEEAKNTRLEAEAERSLKPRIADIEHQNHQLLTALEESKRNCISLDRARHTAESNANHADALKSQCLQLRDHIDRLNHDLESSKRTIAQLKATHANDLAQLRAALKKDRAATAQALKNQTNAIRKQAQDKLKREKKRADAYKDRAVKEKERAAKATDALARAASSRVDEVTFDFQHNLAATASTDPTHSPSPATRNFLTGASDTFDPDLTQQGLIIHNAAAASSA